MSICTGWSPPPPPVQVHVAPSLHIISNASVKVKDCCTNNFLWQSFQLKKSHNNSVLPG